jgi:hypothetical protein
MAEAEKLVFKQIEELADYHPPAIYDLLSKCVRFGTEPDDAADEFIPISQAAISGRNPKLFVIGVLPPTATVSERALDRSASIVALRGLVSDPLIAEATPAQTTGTGITYNGKVVPKGAEPALTYGHGVPNIGTKDGTHFGKGAPLGDRFWINYVAMCTRLKVDPKDLALTIASESGFNTTATAVRNGKPVAKGLNQIMAAQAKKMRMSDEEYARFGEVSAERQLYWAEKFFSTAGLEGLTPGQIYARNFGDANAKLNPGGGVLYASLAYQNEHGGPGAFHHPTGGSTSAFQDKAYRDNKSLDSDGDGAITYADMDRAAAKAAASFQYGPEIDKAMAALQIGAEDYTKAASPAIDPDANDQGWQDNGSKNANSAQKGIQDASKGDFNNLTRLGENLQAAQKAMRSATKAALEQMANTPPLRLIVNPQSFRVSSQKVISDGSHSRAGPIVEHWGESQDQIEGSGKIAAFYAIDRTNASGPGLTRTARAASASYQNLMALYLLYKNNATLWLSEFGDNQAMARDVTLSVVGSIYIYYDGILYLGSFDTFSITEADTAPFSLDYSFSFVVRSSFLFDTDENSLRTLAEKKGNSLKVREVDAFGVIKEEDLGGGPVAQAVTTGTDIAIDATTNFLGNL